MGIVCGLEGQELELEGKEGSRVEMGKETWLMGNSPGEAGQKQGGHEEPGEMGWTLVYVGPRGLLLALWMLSRVTQFNSTEFTLTLPFVIAFPSMCPVK